jgi:hypothetical protein
MSFRLPSLAAAVVFALAVAPAHALTVVSESEPNNSLAAAQALGAFPADGRYQVNGSRVNDDSDDFYSFAALAGPLSIVVSSPTALADSVMGLYGPGGMLVASNDDAAPGNGLSAIQFNVPTAGTYRIGLSGFNPNFLSCSVAGAPCYDTNGDFAFDTYAPGAGGSYNWAYGIAITSVPEPETWFALAAGLALLAGRGLRRRAA